MTPSEIARDALLNIERARAVIGDGACGYVLVTARGFVLCGPADDAHLGTVTADSVIVHSSIGRAEVMQRHWNYGVDDDERTVSIALRREAFDIYISRQQALVNFLLESAT
jgi:hypothetical protein